MTPGQAVRARPACLPSAFVLWVWPTNEYIFLPDLAHPVAPLVTVDGGHRPEGRQDLLRRRDRAQGDDARAALRRAARAAQTLARPTVDPPGVTTRSRRAGRPARRCELSQQTAAAVALRASGHKVTTQPIGALIEDGRARPPRGRQARAERRDHRGRRQAGAHACRGTALMSRRRDRPAGHVHDPARRQRSGRADQTAAAGPGSHRRSSDRSSPVPAETSTSRST